MMKSPPHGGGHFETLNTKAVECTCGYTKYDFFFFPRSPISVDQPPKMARGKVNHVIDVGH